MQNLTQSRKFPQDFTKNVEAHVDFIVVDRQCGAEADGIETTSEEQQPFAKSRFHRRIP
jgi:hypothetical protein